MELTTIEYYNQICSAININFLLKIPIVSVAPLHIVENDPVDSSYNSEASIDAIPINDEQSTKIISVN
jgi:hypothetical protein